MCPQVVHIKTTDGKQSGPFCNRGCQVSSLTRLSSMSQCWPPHIEHGLFADLSANHLKAVAASSLVSFPSASGIACPPSWDPTKPLKHPPDDGNATITRII